MRRRMIDPAFWNDSKIIEISFEARLLYIGLWNYADDEGFFLDDLPAIKRTLFPDQKFDIHGVFSECSRFLKHHFYKGHEQFAWEISQFSEWQTINRPTPSKIKPFCELIDDSVSPHGALTLKLSKEKISKEKIKASVDADLIARFWNEYPKKVGKGEVEKIWMKLNPGAELVDHMVEAIKTQKRWRDNAGPKEFRPEWKNPATWLNQKCWEDQPELEQAEQEIPGMSIWNKNKA